MHLTNLRCEYFVNPLGIDTVRPRLSWEMLSELRGAQQTAYQVVAEDLDGFLWDSGKVESGQSIHVVYGGPELHSGQRVSWKVRIWDEQGQESNFSEPAWWEMGLLAREEWKGDWIGSALVGGPRSSAPCPYLRKTVQIGKAVASARLYVTALGVYEFQINGQMVGDQVFAPGWTDYKVRVQSQTYDVTGMLRDGENVLGTILGDGWYCGYVAALDRQQYGDRPKLLAQLVVRYTDGSEDKFVSDGSWKWSAGAILESDFLQGEAYDARAEMPGWSAPGFDSANWQPVEVFSDPGIVINARRNPPVRHQEELTPTADPKAAGDWVIKNWIFDLGQNMVGRVRLKVSGSSGLTVRLRYSEALNPDGTLHTIDLRSARATDYYTLKGEGVEIYEPKFTFHGFRYVEVFGIHDTPSMEMITGLVLHSDTPAAGDFECSDPLVNQLQHNIQWSQKGNFLEVPTDCPQRDERLGWTGDAQVFIRTATFNRDVAAFFTKWQQDMADAQTPVGQIPPVVPNIDPFYLSRDGGPAWADAVVICPWTIYLAYADTRLLEQYFDSLKTFVEYLRNSSLNLIRVHPRTEWKDGNWQGFGDWLSTNAETPKDLIGTAFFAYSAGLLAKVAEVLGKADEAAQYLQLADAVREAFMRRYVTRDGLVAGLTQTGYVLGLYFDLLPAQLRATAAEDLARSIEDRKWHLSTGFVGTPYILQTLTQAGKLDVAYKLLFQKSWPSWLYPVTVGATTIWERWDGWTDDKGFQTPEMNSFNHYAYGAVGAWLYSTVAGIDIDPQQPGYKHILFQPMPGGGLTSARARTHSMHGDVLSSWKLNESGLDWEIVVPPNTSGTAWIPGGEGKTVTESGHPVLEAQGVTFQRYENGAAVFTLESGTYRFRAE